MEEVQPHTQPEKKIKYSTVSMDDIPEYKPPEYVSPIIEKPLFSFPAFPVAQNLATH
jgi:hypothetical protein